MKDYDRKKMVNVFTATAQQRFKMFYHMERWLRREFGHSCFPRQHSRLSLTAWRIALQRKIAQ